MHSNLIVARMDIRSREGAGELFTRSGKPHMPRLMGARKWQPIAYRRLYVIYRISRPDYGSQLMEKAKADPRFVRFSDKSWLFISSFCPATWLQSADAMATRFNNLGSQPMIEGRIVIDVLAAKGAGAHELWQLLGTGRMVTRSYTYFGPSPYRSQAAAEVDFDPKTWAPRRAVVSRTDRAAQFAVAVAPGAMSDSDSALSRMNRHRMNRAATSLDEQYKGRQ